MRMWMVNTEILCRKHLLGEHVEIHMLTGSIRRNKSIQGFLDKKILEPVSLYNRHEQLVDEMTSRGYNHNSPIDEYFSSEEFKHSYRDHYVEVFESLEDLINRCDKCYENYSKWITDMEEI